MKKPIDPNLSNIDEKEMFRDLDIQGAENVNFKLNSADNNAQSSDSDRVDSFTVQDIIDEIEIKPLSDFANKNKSPEKPISSITEHSHHHHHDHKHSSGKKSGKNEKLPIGARIAIGILLALLGVVVVACIAFFVMRGLGHMDMLNKQTSSDETGYQETIEYKGHTYKYNEDVSSIAFLGIDQRTLKDVKSTDFVGASDADIVVAINTKTGETKVIAIPRDTMVDVDIWSTSGIFLRTQQTQLCLAYAYGDGRTKSCQNAVTAISRVLYNVPIQKYFALDLDGIAPLNDAIGGVTLTAKYSLPAYNIKYGETVTLLGDAAEAYVRTRDMDNLNASLGRTERQVQYVNSFTSQALPAVVKDFSTISRLYNTSSKYSQTNLSLNNVTYLASLLLSKGVTDYKTYTIKGEMKADDDPLIADVVHAEFYPDEDNLMETVLDVFYTQVD